MMFEWRRKDVGVQKVYSLKVANVEIRIEDRPHGHNRGNWIAKLDWIGHEPIHVSESDLWPRYYFGDLKLAMEQCEAWLKAHGVTEEMLAAR